MPRREFDEVLDLLRHHRLHEIHLRRVKRSPNRSSLRPARRPPTSAIPTSREPAPLRATNIPGRGGPPAGSSPPFPTCSGSVRGSCGTARRSGSSQVGGRWGLRPRDVRRAGRGRRGVGPWRLGLRLRVLPLGRPCTRRRLRRPNEREQRRAGARGDRGRLARAAPRRAEAHAGDPPPRAGGARGTGRHLREQHGALRRGACGRGARGHLGRRGADRVEDRRARLPSPGGRVPERAFDFPLDGFLRFGVLAARV